MSKRMAVILAAGKGTRMKSDKYKVLHEINGRTMVGHVLNAVQSCGVERVVTIIGNGADEVQAALGDQSEYVLQEEQLGTAHAVLTARELLAAEKGSTLVICGDTPLLSEETLQQLFSYHEAQQSKATILTAVIPDAGDYGRIIRNAQGQVEGIVEKRDATPDQIAIQEFNTGTFVFDNEWLYRALDEVGNDNAQGEYYLTDVIGILQQAGQHVDAYIMDDASEAIGINDRKRLADVTDLMTQRINQRHMDNGVTFIHPATTYIEVGVEIGSDTVIEGGVSLKGTTKIGSHCHIGSHSEIVDSEIGDAVLIRQSVIESSVVGSRSDVGPFAHLRPQSHLGEQVHIGNFVEVKKSYIGNRSKAGHLTYIGDGHIGEDVNVGCGTIFANYDGKHKHLSEVGDGSFIGSGSILVSPVKVGHHAVTAAGSTINQDIPDEGLGIARAKQVNKAHYWHKFNQK